MPATIAPTKLKAVPPAAIPKNRVLQIVIDPGKSPDRQLTDLVASGVATNAATAMRFVRGEQGALSLTDMVASLAEHGAAVNRGDLAVAEQMLNSQAVALNAIFSEMARRAAGHMDEHIEAMGHYMRLALKAQGQCRSTLETLAAIKNPPVVFARQANIANGPLQVNNCAPEGSARELGSPTSTVSIAHTQGIGKLANELLGAENGTRLDIGAPLEAIGVDSRLAALGEVHRAKVGARESPGGGKQPKARGAIGTRH